MTVRTVLFTFALSLLVATACGDDDNPAVDAGPDVGAAAIDPTDAVVEIDIAPADWDARRFEHHDFLEAQGPGCQSSPPAKPYNYYPATVSIDGEQVANVGVRKKGFLGSVTPQRPSLNVKFDENVPDQKLLVAFRDKDRDFVRVLLREHLITAALLRTRLVETTIDAALRPVLCNWVNATAKELGLA